MSIAIESHLAYYLVARYYINLRLSELALLVALALFIDYYILEILSKLPLPIYNRKTNNR